MRHPIRRRMMLLLAVFALAGASCSGDARTLATLPDTATSTDVIGAPGDVITAGDGTVSTSPDGPTIDGPTIDGPTIDGPFVLGVLLPLTGPGAELGSTLSDGVDLAIADIDAAGGLLGFPVEVVEGDEGGDATTATRAVDALLARGVDAIIGPASSLTAATVLPVTTRAGVLTCSPTASALALDSFPSEGLFVRTIPSDSLQASAIAEHVLETGAASTAVLYLNDAYGRPFADVVTAELEERALDVRAVVPFDAADSDYSDETRKIASTGADVVVVIGDGSDGPRVVDDLFDVVGDDTQVVINDAMRVPSAASVYQRLSESARTRLTGLSPSSRVVDNEFATRLITRHPESSGVFSGNAYDCVTLIGLAVRATESADARTVADEIEAVTHLGSECIDFETCAAGLAARLNINYDGPSGNLHIGESGKPVRGTFDRFEFDAQGRDITITASTLVVGL